MTATRKPSKNGHAHQRNGHAPASRLAGVVPPLDAVSTAEGPKPASDENPATEGRTAKGTFAPGNHFARGNPNARKMAALRAALLESATVERMKALGEKLYEMAMVGDLVAAKLLLAYAIGKAPEAADPDRLDLDEWQIAAAAPTNAQFLRAMLDSVEPLSAALYLQLLMRQPEKTTKAGSITLRRLEEEIDAAEADGLFGKPGFLMQAFAGEREARIGK